ncbi:MAG: hypothetical protein A2Y40_10040 [Candidatus Margulisbacteria bacterium GWF2_35_9]|nr:MAG: hypothetical protein A2Y40_10040 [Candidatus Margulisbacteria bacterium GWF2_35_9]
MNNPNYKLIKKQIFSITNKDSLIENKGVLITSTERALIEMADLVPKQATFEEFVKIMELCAGSRPTLVQELLINCTAVKAKRIFLMVAEYVNHPWFKKLDISKIDLGKGDRQIVKNGTYNKKYKICVPNINHYEL